jgi:polysaccharide pyruvyl transferase WcaK-like protein
MSDPKTLFLLVPPAEYTRHMPNMGDRALHDGMRALWRASHGGPLVFDEWNSFPRLTWKRLAVDGRIAPERFEALHASLLGKRPWAFSKVLAGLLFGQALAWLPGWSVLERKARQNTGQSGREVLEPRLFPRLAARRFAERMGRSDAVIMNAGGLLADHLARYLPGRIFALYAAIEAGLPTAVVNYSFAVSRPELLEWVAPVMRRVGLHAVREGVSRERLMEIGVPAERIMVVGDAALAVPGPDIKGLAQRERIIALQARGDCEQDVDAWAELAARLRERFEARIVYLAGCRKYDLGIIDGLSSRGVLDASLVPDSPQELKAAIDSSMALVTDRYHGVIFAAQTGTPFVPLSGTTHKTAGLLQGIGYPLRARSRLRADQVEELLEDVGRCLARGPELQASLLEYCETARARLMRDYSRVIAGLFGLGERADKMEER